MLINLTIRNFGLIEKSSLELGAGFGVVTGETGAGKSMFIDALAFCLGGVSNEKYIRAGADDLAVEAVFEVNDDLAKLLKIHDISPEGGEVFIRRTLSRGGNAKASICDMRVTKAVLNEIGEKLVDIHGQNDQQILLKPSRHAGLLDNFGDYAELLSEVKNTWKKWRDIKTELTAAQTRIDDREREEILLKAYVEELDNLAYAEGEEETLAEERKLLMGAEQMAAAVQTAVDALDGDGGVVEALGIAEGAFAAAAHNSSAAMQTLAQRLSEVYNEALDVAREISRAGEVEANPERLQEVDDRLAAMTDCARKHRVEISQLSQKHDEMAAKLAALGNLQEDISRLQQEEKKTFEKLEKLAQKLTKERQKTAKDLSIKVEKALENLKMPNCKFVAQLKPLEVGEISASGAEKVEFMVSTNAAQAEPEPLVQVASGGEVSRLMLVLKAVFYAKINRMTLIFDEVDTGIGGAVAAAVGKALKELAQQHQVFAITHQPQVAACGASHVFISKQQAAKSTTTSVGILQNDERVDEIARMLSGAEITEAARTAAQSLLRSSV